MTPPPSYELHTEDPLDVNTVPFECCVAVKKNDVWFSEEDEEENGFFEAFVLFFPVTLDISGGSYTIAVLGDRHA